MPATKDEIADRFWQHVEHYGFAKTSVGDIAGELGISKTTIYQHFASKDDILRYVVEDAAKREVDSVEEEYADLPTYWDRFEKLTRERVLASTRTYDRLVRRWAAEGAEAGEFHLVHDDVLLTARFVGSILQYAIAQTRADRSLDIDDAVVEAIRKLLV